MVDCDKSGVESKVDIHTSEQVWRALLRLPWSLIGSVDGVQVCECSHRYLPAPRPLHIVHAVYIIHGKSLRSFLSPVACSISYLRQIFACFSSDSVGVVVLATKAHRCLRFC
jgi:hypothetical protein